VENVTDIVERLHWDAAAQRSGSETEKLEREAAAEIERLRADVSRYGKIAARPNTKPTWPPSNTPKPPCAKSMSTEKPDD
jgi:hypothetical protein